MNNEFGELTKKAEILEINFLQEMGIETIGKYPEVENHIDKMIDILIEKNDDLQDISDINVEELEQDLEDKTNAIDSASCTLYNLKKVVESMRKSDMKTTLLSYIEDMEMDLC
jgi:polyhydroxyalkanoate synthesis regulator phasin